MSYSKKCGAKIDGSNDGFGDTCETVVYGSKKHCDRCMIPFLQSQLTEAREIIKIQDECLEKYVGTELVRIENTVMFERGEDGERVVVGTCARQCRASLAERIKKIMEGV